MKINTYHLIEGARQAKGVAVVIDVFRAFTVECYLANNNAALIMPVADKDFAYRLREQNPDYILLGEREGIMLPGFDYGNSPAQIENVDFSGRTIVHTTSAGTQGLENATGADVILTGSLVNSKAIAGYILKNGFKEVSLIAMGLAATSETPEDTLCAFYIERLLSGYDDDISAEIKQLKKTSGAKFFDPAKSEFPERDFALCTELNKFNFVLKVEKAEGTLKCVKIGV